MASMNRFESRGGRRKFVAPAVALGVGLLLVESCTIDSYLTDTTAVQCDGKRTMGEFNDQASRVEFLVHQKHEPSLSVMVTEESPAQYDFSVKPSTDVQQAGRLTVDGSASTDMSFTYHGGTWSIDVRPKDQTVVISGNC